MRRKLLLGCIALGLFAGAAVLWFGGWPGGAPPEAGPVRLAVGRALYGEHCAACHGADLEGEPNWRVRGSDGLLPAPPHDETGHTWHHPDRHLFEITKYGTAALVGPGYKTNMAGFGDVLSDAEIEAVLAYIKSRWSDEIRRRQAEITARDTRN